MSFAMSNYSDVLKNPYFLKFIDANDHAALLSVSRVINKGLGTPQSCEMVKVIRVPRHMVEKGLSRVIKLYKNAKLDLFDARLLGSRDINNNFPDREIIRNRHYQTSDKLYYSFVLIVAALSHIYSYQCFKRMLSSADEELSIQAFSSSVLFGYGGLKKITSTGCAVIASIFPAIASMVTVDYTVEKVKKMIRRYFFY